MEATVNIDLTEEMIESARRQVEAVRVRRTRASEIDTIAGILGEYAFAEYWYGDWKQNLVGANKGQEDFPDIEIKASAYPFSSRLNLLVRCDYAAKRKPRFYVQIIIDVEDPKAAEIQPGTVARICGCATAKEVDVAPTSDFGSKLGGVGGYKCHYICIANLHPLSYIPRGAVTTVNQPR